MKWRGLNKQDQSSLKEEIAIKLRIAGLLPFATVLALLFTDALTQEVEDESSAGKLAFNSSCRTCHSMDEGDNRLGPSLHGIVGREAGSLEYGYSPAMAASSVVWDAETLDRFIKNPEAVIPGNNMKPYGGISDAEIRASIVNYLGGESSEDAGEDE